MIKLNVKILRLGYKNKICKSKTTQKSLLKLPMLSALQEKEFLLPMSQQELLETDSVESKLKTTTRTDKPTENFYSQLLILKNI